MKFRTTIRMFGLVGLGAVAWTGCGSAPPPRELVDARAAFTRVQSDPATRLKPDSLVDAKAALARAEQAYASSANDRDVRKLAYVAQRKAELADIQAHDVLNTQEQKQAENEIQQITQQQLSVSTQQLQREQQRRADAERMAREALDRLSSSVEGSAVREEPRGIVITIPGQVLFVTGKSTLLPSARQKLNQVAAVLNEQPDRHIVVEGHTDSTGTDARNQVLSQQRAESVRDYLVSRGVSRDAVVAKGMAASHPVASNDTPENRANNRRVEIIIEPSSAEPKR
jgi:outer membrane protein OmpA-like peptidoglycan-associated protein